MDDRSFGGYAARGSDAFRETVRNKRSHWSRSADPEQANAVGKVYRPVVKPPFHIDRSRPIFALGSCFAQEIQFELITRGYPVATWIDQTEHPEYFAQMVSDSETLFMPMHFFHRYNPPSILQELQRLTEPDHPLNGDALLFEATPGRWADFHYHEHFRLPDREAAVARRAYLARRFAGLGQAGLFIMTLGLTEAWFDKASGLYLNTAPSYAMVTGNPDRFEFRVLDFQTVRDTLEAIIALLARAFPQTQVLVTVSPIPLDLTFSDKDVVSATAYSKATLLSAAHELVARHPHVAYFPSFEMVGASDRTLVWKDDQRHVTRSFVGEIMGHFIASFEAPAPAAPVVEAPPAPLPAQEAPSSSRPGLADRLSGLFRPRSPG